MANEILKLSNLDITEVSKQTRIPLEYLEYIINKNFDKLKDINLKAYLKIISREYDIDLGGYLDEYEAYCSENSDIGANSKVQVNPRLSGYSAKEKNNSFAWLVLLLILIGVGVWAFKFIKDFDFSVLKPEFASTELNASNNNSLLKIEPELNATQLPAEPSNNEEEEKDDNQTALMIASIYSDEENKIEAPKQLDTAKLVPTKNIWIGIKNLDDMSKRSFNTKDPVDINLSGNRLILTGHGMLNLEVGDKNESFNTRDALRFHANNGEMRKIDYDEYIELNKGKSW